MVTWLWLPLALGAALSVALADLTVKRFFADLSPFTMCLVRWLFPLPFLALVGLTLKWPALDSTFWLAGAAALPLELLAAYLYMQVLKICHLSLCIPLLAFTPVFLVLTGWLLLGEALNLAGMVGLALVAGGSYFLGYAVAGLSILGSVKSQIGAAILIPLLALGIPLFDTILSPIRRFVRGRQMFKPDSGLSQVTIFNRVPGGIVPLPRRNHAVH